MSQHLNFLYIGQRFSGSTSENRRRMIERLGHTTVAFDTTPYCEHRQRVLRSIAHRLNAGPSVAALNRDLLQFAAGLPTPVDYIWVDKGKWLTPETLTGLRHLTDAVLVHYTPDAQLLDNASRQFNASLPVYDALFTTKPFELAHYRRRGGRNVFLVNQSYDADRLFPRVAGTAELLASEVCFIGHCQPHYADVLRAARRASGAIRVWGPGWRRYARRHGWANALVAGDGLWGEDYARALNAASIGLCLLSKRIPESTTTRTFEIPGCGTFMLAERTEQHLALFREAEEAEFFDSNDELVEKITFYLSHTAERERIAAAGHRRCIESGYSDLHCMRRLIDIAVGIGMARKRDASTATIAARALDGVVT